MFWIQFFFFFWLCWNLIKEIFLFQLLSFQLKKVLQNILIFYFLLVVLFLKDRPFSILFLLLPLVFFLFLFVFLNKQEERKLLSQLYSFLIPLESQMKLGLSFMNAWQKGVQDLPKAKVKDKLQKITEVLKFQKNFTYRNKDIENFVKDLILIYQSTNPLKRLKQLQRKIKIEQSFHIKSKRTLLQTRIQAGVLSFLYLGLLAWTIFAYGKKYSHLIFLSLIFFSIGFFWILKTGRKMKWSV